MARVSLQPGLAEGEADASLRRYGLKAARRPMKIPSRMDPLAGLWSVVLDDDPPDALRSKPRVGPPSRSLREA